LAQTTAYLTETYPGTSLSGLCCWNFKTGSWSYALWQSAVWHFSYPYIEHLYTVSQSRSNTLNGLAIPLTCLKVWNYLKSSGIRLVSQPTSTVFPSHSH